jgi:hypothetical protein
MPAIDYEPFIIDRTERLTTESLAREPHRPAEAPETRRASLLSSTRDHIAAWTLLGNHYADVLENPDASAELHNVIGEELDELADKANLHITSPEVLRLVYPWLRFRALERQWEREGKGGRKR